MSDIQIRLDGVPSANATIASLSIHEVLSASPNTGTLTFVREAPEAGQQIEVALVSESPERILFAGELQAVDESYDLQYENKSWAATLIDQTFQANKRRPFGTFVDVSASTVALAIAAGYAPTCTTVGVAAGLPNISITFDGSEPFMTAWQRIATAINGRGSIDYGSDLRLELTDSGEAPDPIDTDHPPLNVPPIVFGSDLSQIRTRLLGKGHAENTPTDVLAADTIVPVADAVMFNPDGGQAITGVTADGAQSQIVDYASIQLGGDGTLVGPGAQPSSAPVLARVAGGSLGNGVYEYAYTDVTAAGESLPSPLASVTTGGVPATDPAAMGTLASFTDASGSLSSPGAYRWAFTFERDADGYETALSPVSTPGGANWGGLYARIDLSGCTSAPSGFTRRWYRTAMDGSVYMRVAVTGHNINGDGSKPSGVETGGFFYDDSGDGTLGAVAPASNETAAVNQFDLSGIALGGAIVTQRKIYRTVVNGSQLKLQQTIANNTSTVGVRDTTADGSLGANAPTSDTSGISFAGGQINPGSTSLLTASPAPFSGTGGWAVSGPNVIRYTGLSGNNLTGIPASGPGSILTVILYGDKVVPSPALVGVNAAHSPAGIVTAMAKGSPVAIWVQRDDFSAQAALAALEGGDGIREDHLFDGRLAEDTLIAQCDARLDAFGRPIISADYWTLDVKTRAGATVAIGLTTEVDGMFDPAVFDASVFGAVTGQLPYGLSGDFTIQDVTKGVIGARQQPILHAQASSVAFTLMDFMRLAQIGNN